MDTEKWGVPENIPMKYDPETVQGLTPEEVTRINQLVDEFPTFTENDPRHQEWLALDRKVERI